MAFQDKYKSISLRLYKSDDMDFMRSLYASTREDELTTANFSPEEKDAFIQQQFSAQFLHYTQHYCTDEFYIIECEGNAIGRLFVDYWDNEIRIVDIALHSDYRNRGIGTYLLSNLIEEAERRTQPLTIHVEYNNPVKSLYERLGFVLKTKTNDIYLLMERLPKA